MRYFACRSPCICEKRSYAHQVGGRQRATVKYTRNGDAREEGIGRRGHVAQTSTRLSRIPPCLEECKERLSINLKKQMVPYISGHSGVSGRQPHSIRITFSKGKKKKNSLEETRLYKRRFPCVISPQGVLIGLFCPVLKVFCCYSMDDQ